MPTTYTCVNIPPIYSLKCKESIIYYNTKLIKVPNFTWMNSGIKSGFICILIYHAIGLSILPIYLINICFYKFLWIHLKGIDFCFSWCEKKHDYCPLSDNWKSTYKAIYLCSVSYCLPIKDSSSIWKLRNTWK